MYTKSKKVGENTVCQMRGNKLVRAGKRTKTIAGVWTNGYRNVILLPSGDRQTIDTPQGLLTYGPCTVFLEREKK
jgi:hypothetical protein